MAISDVQSPISIITVAPNGAVSSHPGAPESAPISLRPAASSTQGGQRSNAQPARVLLPAGSESVDYDPRVRNASAQNKNSGTGAIIALMAGAGLLTGVGGLALYLAMRRPEARTWSSLIPEQTRPSRGSVVEDASGLDDVGEPGVVTNLREAADRPLWQVQSGNALCAKYASDALLNHPIDDETWRDRLKTFRQSGQRGADPQHQGDFASGLEFANLHNQRLGPLRDAGAINADSVAARDLRLFEVGHEGAFDGVTRRQLNHLSRTSLTFRQVDGYDSHAFEEHPRITSARGSNSSALFGDVDRFAVHTLGHWVAIRYLAGAWREIDSMKRPLNDPEALPPPILERAHNARAGQPIAEATSRGALRALLSYADSRGGAATTTPLHVLVPLR